MDGKMMRDMIDFVVKRLGLELSADIMAMEIEETGTEEDE